MYLNETMIEAEKIKLKTKSDFLNMGLCKIFFSLLSRLNKRVWLVIDQIVNVIDQIVNVIDQIVN